ncbi:hypothetical protein EJB05_00513, partial [Eragrostis curvula]
MHLFVFLKTTNQIGHWSTQVGDLPIAVTAFLNLDAPSACPENTRKMSDAGSIEEDLPAALFLNPPDARCTHPCSRRSVQQIVPQFDQKVLLVSIHHIPEDESHRSTEALAICIIVPQPPCLFVPSAKPEDVRVPVRDVSHVFSAMALPIELLLMDGTRK